jgi:hypothetical protein
MYVDNVLMVSKDATAHETHQRLVFGRLRQYNIDRRWKRSAPKKCRRDGEGGDFEGATATESSLSKHFTILDALSGNNALSRRSPTLDFLTLSC